VSGTKGLSGLNKDLALRKEKKRELQGRPIDSRLAKAGAIPTWLTAPRYEFSNEGHVK
jgi:hypothetical protein